MECANLDSNILIDCDNPLQAGTRDRMVLINYQAWLDAVMTTATLNSEIIESIALASGDTGYLIEGINNSNEPLVTFKRSRYLGSFEHQVKFKGFDVSPTVKSALEKLSKGRVVAIVENNYKGTDGNCAFDVYGADGGLIMPDGGLIRDPSSTDTQGAYDVTLKSSEFSMESRLPKRIFLTDYTTSKAIFDSLYTA